jgi:hypothetical protein
MDRIGSIARKLIRVGRGAEGVGIGAEEAEAREAEVWVRRYQEFREGE